MDMTAVLLAIPAAGFIFYLGTVFGYAGGYQRCRKDATVVTSTR